MKKLGMMKTILMMGCALALLFAAVPQPVMAANSQMNLTVGTTNDAKAGDTVTVRLVGSNNPGLSTFAARLAYDDSDLEYVGTTWANTISSDSGNIELVSPVTENNQQALNLSAILNKTYSQNETIATVTFKAKNAYTTMPVTLTVREVTDASYNPVTVTTVVDASAGQTQSQSQSQSQSTSQSQSDSQDDTEYIDDTDSYDDTEDTQDSQSSSGNTHKTSSNKKNNSGNTSKNGNRTDATPKTGAVDLRMVFGAAVIVFLLVAAGCIRFLNKKKE
ncbi:MAG: hypothetical protein J6P08_08270 [Agathobacter sp.]|nr:hypothetical protein [Agathobacter sp.]